MSGTPITTTPVDITGDFDLQVLGSPSTPGQGLVLQKALGSGGTNFTTFKVIAGTEHMFVKNTGTNAYKLAASVSGMSAEFNQ